jgi:sortase (surface protein transpeptidase)
VGSAGELIVPASPMDVGWYQGGAVPGESGVALLTSHVDTRREGRGVFAGLVELLPGDSVLLETAEGTLQRWTVVARTQHRKDALPPELFARSGVAKLALVTCGGPFDRERRSYRDNVIVWAEPTA